MDRMPEDGPGNGRGAREGPAGAAPEASGPMAEADADCAEALMGRLARTIEREVIPRLMLVHRLPVACPIGHATSDPGIVAADVEHFARLVIADDDAAALGCIEALRERGVPVESLYLHLLAPAARHLGEMWNDDLCDFTAVTLGLGRLQQLLRRLSASFMEAPTILPPNGRRILLLPAPGEQHTFGLVMVGEFFRRAGWEVAGGAWERGGQAPLLVGVDWYDMVGFSMAAEIHVDALRSVVDAARQASVNPDIGIMVGGPAFIGKPEAVVQVGADVHSTDGRHAPGLAEQWIGQRIHRCPGASPRRAQSGDQHRVSDATGRM